MHIQRQADSFAYRMAASLPTEDELSGLQKEFDDWWDAIPEEKRPRPDGNCAWNFNNSPITSWENVEKFLSEHYPQAHSGAEWSEDAIGSAMGKNYPDYVRPVSDQRTLANMIMLHRRSQGLGLPNRGAWTPDEAALYNTPGMAEAIVKGRNKMQRDYEKRMLLNANTIRCAMPAPAPEGLTFHHYPHDDPSIQKVTPEMRHLMKFPAVEARVNGEHAGFISWDEHPRSDGEIAMIIVPKKFRHQSIATSLFDHARTINPNLHHSPIKTEEGQAWSEYEQGRKSVHANTIRCAMPAPLPQNITFKYHPDDSTIEGTMAEGVFYAPAVSAHIGNDPDHIGYISWFGDDYLDPDEVSMIEVDPHYRRSGVATALFDHAKKMNPKVHHSTDQTDLGHSWSDYEQSRKTKAANTIRCATYEHAVLDRPTDSFLDRMMAGTLKGHQYPSEVDFPLYHGSRSGDFQPGDLIEPGHPGNFVRRMKHVYSADHPVKCDQYGSVYEVRPTGPIGHRSDARARDGYFASEWPYEVVRKVDPAEYAEDLKNYSYGHPELFHPRKALRDNTICCATPVYRGLVVPSPVDLEGLARSVGRSWTTDEDRAMYFSDPDEYVGVPSVDTNGLRGQDGSVGVWLEGELDDDPDSIDTDWDRIQTNEDEIRLKPGTPVRVKNINYVYRDDGFDDENVLSEPRVFRARKSLSSNTIQCDDDDPVFDDDEITFQHHPGKGYNSEKGFLTPALEALHGRRSVGFLSYLDDPDPEKQGEVSLIWVRPEYRSRGIADRLYDTAKNFEPNIHHSDTQTTKGKAWAEHEKARNIHSHNTIRCAADDDLILYHGTGADSVPHIQQNGLMHPPGVSPAGWPMLTTDFDQAKAYATRDNPVVLEYHVPANLTYGRWRTHRTGEEPYLWDAEPHTAYDYPAQSYALKRPLPATFLHAIHPVQRKLASRNTIRCAGYLGETPIVVYNNDPYEYDIDTRQWVRYYPPPGYDRYLPYQAVTETDPTVDPASAEAAYNAHITKKRTR